MEKIIVTTPDEMREIIQEVVREIVKTLETKEPAPLEPEMLTVPEAAKLLRVSIQTLYKWTWERKIPSYKNGKTLWFKRSELLAQIEKRRRKSIDEIHIEAETELLNTKRKR